MKTFEKIRSVRRIKSTILIFLVVLLATVSCATAAPLSADFITIPPNGTANFAPLTVQFTDATTGSPAINWTWNFADGTGPALMQNPSHIFQSAGIFPVSLTVWNVTTTMDTSTITHNVTVTPFAQFTPFTFTGYAPLNVQFTDTSTGQPNIWSWYFGDGNTSAQQNPANLYVWSGIYKVNLTVQKNGLTNKSANGTMTVNPKADFTITPSPGKAGSPIQFNATITTGGPKSFVWFFEPSNTSYSNPSGVVNHTFPIANTYVVGLNVTGNATTSDQITHSVAAYPTALFTQSPPGNVIEGRTVTFTDASIGVGGSGNADSYSWNFGDGATSTAVSPTHIYKQGKYFVTLTVTKNGLSDTSVPVQINVDSGLLGPLRSGINGNTLFRASKYAGFAPFTVSFIAYPTRNVTSETHFAWDFGDGGTATIQRPSHTYISPGVYTVSLTVSDTRDSYTIVKPRYIVVKHGGGGI